MSENPLVIMTGPGGAEEKFQWYSYEFTLQDLATGEERPVEVNWNVGAVMALCLKHGVSRILPRADFQTWFDLYDPTHINREWALGTDLTRPLLFVDVDPRTIHPDLKDAEPMGTMRVLVDGYHRLYKAIHDPDIRRLFCRVLPAEFEPTARLSDAQVAWLRSMK